MTSTMLEPATAARPTRQGPSRTRGQLARTVSYGAAALRRQLGDVSFLFFTVALPVTMYLVFAGIYGDVPVDQPGGATVAGIMMVTMAAYGGLGAAMNAGFTMHEEQRNGWFRQLSLTGLSSVGLVLVRIVVSSVVIVPAVAVLFAVAKLYKHVSLPWQAYLASGLVLWLTLVPMVLIGLAIALWLPSSSGQALVTITLMVLSILGGLWFPITMFPEWLQRISKFLPSYCVGDLGIAPVLGEAPSGRSIATLVVWSVSLVVVCLLGYRRAIRTRS